MNLTPFTLDTALAQRQRPKRSVGKDRGGTVKQKIKTAESFPAALDLKAVKLFRRLVSSLLRISVKHHFSVLNSTGSVLTQAGPREWQLSLTQ